MIKARNRKSNIFADLKVPDAATHLLKAELVARIQHVLGSRELTQARAAEVLGISQPDVSRLLRGQFREMSVERLVALLVRLGCAVDIVVKPPNKRAFAPIHLASDPS